MRQQKDSQRAANAPAKGVTYKQCQENVVRRHLASDIPTASEHDDNNHDCWAGDMKPPVTASVPKRESSVYRHAEGHRGKCIVT